MNPATDEMRLKAKVVADLLFTGDLAHEAEPYHPETEEAEAVSVITTHCKTYHNPIYIPTSCWNMQTPTKDRHHSVVIELLSTPHGTL